MNQIESADDKIKRLEAENAELRAYQRKRQQESYCREFGHDWYRHPYCGIGDTNYLTCQRCGAEKTD